MSASRFAHFAVAASWLALTVYGPSTNCAWSFPVVRHSGPSRPTAAAAPSAGLAETPARSALRSRRARASGLVTHANVRVRVGAGNATSCASCTRSVPGLSSAARLPAAGGSAPKIFTQRSRSAFSLRNGRKRSRSAPLRLSALMIGKPVVISR